MWDSGFGEKPEENYVDVHATNHPTVGLVNTSPATAPTIPAPPTPSTAPAPTTAPTAAPALTPFIVKLL